MQWLSTTMVSQTTVSRTHSNLGSSMAACNSATTITANNMTCAVPCVAKESGLNNKGRSSITSGRHLSPSAASVRVSPSFDPPAAKFEARADKNEKSGKFFSGVTRFFKGLVKH